MMISEASKRCVSAGLLIARSSAAQRAGRSAWSIDVPAASCSASTTSASAPASAWRSRSQAAIRRSASSSSESAAPWWWPCASSRNAVSSPRSASNVSAGGCSAASHSRNRRSNCARARCSSCSRSKRACTASRAVVQRARRASSAPSSRPCQRRSMSTIALTIGPGLRRQRLQLHENRVGGFRLARTLGHGIEALPGETRDAAILVLRRVGELAQTLRRVHPFGRVVPRFRDSRRSRQGRPGDFRRGRAPARRGADRHRRCGAPRQRGSRRCRARPRATRLRSRHPRIRPAPCRARRRAPRERPDRSPSRRPWQARQARSTVAPPRCALPARDRR